jgi:hypothetical protein
LAKEEIENRYDLLSGALKDVRKGQMELIAVTQVDYA